MILKSPKVFSICENFDTIPPSIVLKIRPGQARTASSKYFQLLSNSDDFSIFDISENESVLKSHLFSMLTFTNQKILLSSSIIILLTFFGTRPITNYSLMHFKLQFQLMYFGMK